MAHDGSIIELFFSSSTFLLQEDVLLGMVLFFTLLSFLSFITSKSNQGVPRDTVVSGRLTKEFRNFGGEGRILEEKVGVVSQNKEHHVFLVFLAIREELEPATVTV
eukprot:scaffold9395_cov196-Ochromonas_danica.AAC.1